LTRLGRKKTWKSNEGRVKDNTKGKRKTKSGAENIISG